MFTVTDSNAHLFVSSSGKIMTVGKLADDIYTPSGTDADGSNDTGTRTFTLTVGSTQSGTNRLHIYPQDPNLVVIGRTVIYVAFVHATSGTGSLTGTVTFDENGAAVPSCVGIHPLLGRAYGKVSFPDAGLVTVTAVFGNDPNFGGSTDFSIQK